MAELAVHSLNVGQAGLGAVETAEELVPHQPWKICIHVSSPAMALQMVGRQA